MHILLARMVQSPYNRSIWQGLAAAFSALGHHVTLADAERMPSPASARTDLLFAVHGGNLDPRVVDAYRHAGISTAVYLLDEPYEVAASIHWACHYDLVFSVDRSTIPVHARHARAVHLPLAYDATLFGPKGPAVASNILVLGSPFPAREPFLAPLRDTWGSRVTWVGPGWRSFSPAGRHVEGFVAPADCAALYRGADIVVNIHRDAHWSHFGDLNPDGLMPTHLNPRFWEAGACRSCQLCSHRDDLASYAPHTPAFSTPDEMMARLEYLLIHTAARQKAANRLQARVRPHTYLARATAILEEIGPREDTT